MNFPPVFQHFVWHYEVKRCRATRKWRGNPGNLWPSENMWKLNMKKSCTSTGKMLGFAPPGVPDNFHDFPHHFPWQECQRSSWIACQAQGSHVCFSGRSSYLVLVRECTWSLYTHGPMDMRWYGMIWWYESIEVYSLCGEFWIHVDLLGLVYRKPHI